MREKNNWKILGLIKQHVKLLRKLGWAIYFLCFGVLGHDYFHQVWQLKGTIFSVEGGYVGLAFTVVWSLIVYVFEGKKH